MPYIDQATDYSIKHLDHKLNANIFVGLIIDHKNCTTWRNVRIKELLNVTNVVWASWIQYKYKISNMDGNKNCITGILSYSHVCWRFTGCLSMTIFANVTRFATFLAFEVLTISRIEPRPRICIDIFIAFLSSMCSTRETIKTLNDEVDWSEEECIDTYKFCCMLLVNKVVTTLLK